MSGQPPFLTDASGQEHLLDSEVTRLGRAIENELVLATRLASREHARLIRDGRRTFLLDLDSTNGTYLNGERVRGKVSLRDGDQIAIGEIVFIFHDPEMTVRENPLPELEIDRAAGQVRVDRKLVQLSPKEFTLLAFLHENRGKVCSKDEIGRAVWSEYETGIYDYQIENLVRRLRTRIEPDPDQPVLLLTMRGLGYKLV